MSMSGSDSAGGGLNGLLIPGIFVALVVGAYLWFTSQAQETALRASATGFDGLAQWLEAEGADVEIKTSAWPAPPDAYGLRVLPLYDTQPILERDAPTSEEELFLQTDERDEVFDVATDKQLTIPTLYVLPKWRSGMRLSRRAHADFTGDPARLSDWTRLPGKFPGKVRAGGDHLQKFRFAGSDLMATIYAPQVFRDSRCAPLVGTREAMVLGVCDAVSLAPGEQPYVWILSDPDLLNNHGLSLGDNARIAAALLPDVADGRTIVIDYTTSIWAQTDADVVPERTWSDLLRFFAYPFSLLWIGFAAFMALAIWRSWARYGAPLRMFDDEMGAAKDVSVAAKARLLRLSGHDGALVAEHAAQRLHELAATIFGPHRKQMRDPLPHIATWLARRDRALADRFQTATEVARGLAPTAPIHEALSALDEFETCYERVLDDFGGTPGRG